RIVDHVLRDLEANGTFGAQRAHQEMTRPQIEQLAARMPTLKSDARWVDAIVRRMRPAPHVDLDHDVAARAPYAAELWAFASTLPAASNSLKAHVLWHVLDGYRRRDAAPPRELVLAYLQLPRSASYLPRTLVENVHSSEVAKLGINFRNTT